MQSEFAGRHVASFLLDGNLKKFLRVHNFFMKTIKALRLVLPCYQGNCFLIIILGTNKGHNDRQLQPTCRFSLAAIFIWGKKKRWARVAQEVQDHIIHRALVKIPSDLICIIESIRDMSVGISCRKRPGAEEDLCMPVILQLLLCWLFFWNWCFAGFFTPPPPPRHLVG
jgi:hypothetical protein